MRSVNKNNSATAIQQEIFSRFNINVIDKGGDLMDVQLSNLLPASNDRLVNTPLGLRFTAQVWRLENGSPVELTSENLVDLTLGNTVTIFEDEQTNFSVYEYVLIFNNVRAYLVSNPSLEYNVTINQFGLFSARQSTLESSSFNYETGDFNYQTVAVNTNYEINGKIFKQSYYQPNQFVEMFLVVKTATTEKLEQISEEVTSSGRGGLGI